MNPCLVLVIISVSQTATSSSPVDASANPPDLRCGAYCLYVALKGLDVDVSGYDALESRLGQPSHLGYSMEELAEAARSVGAHAEGVETSLTNLTRRPHRFACITLLDDRHFVLVADVQDGLVHVIDPPRRMSSVSTDVFETLWSGKALLISDRPLPPESSLRSGSWMVALLTGAGGAILLLTLLLSRIHARAKT